MILLSDEEINDVWGKIEVTRFTHPDADKPDFQFFDQGIYGEGIAKAQLKKVVEWGNEPCPHSHTIPAYGNVPAVHLHKRACDKCWQALLEEIK